jgi:hypothetical protein
MTPEQQQKHAWAFHAANRLKLQQGSCADATPEERRALLGEELRNLLQPVSIENRLDYLDEVAEGFPTFNNPVVVPGVRAEKAPDKLTDDELLAEVAARAAKLDPAAKARWGKTLADCGFLTKNETATIPDEWMEDLRRQFPLPAGRQVNPRHALQLLSRTADLMVNVEQIVWSVWRVIAPRAKVRREMQAVQMRAHIGRFLAGDPDVSLAQVTDMLEQSRQMLAGMLGAIRQIGRVLSRQYSTKYSAVAIREMIHLEKGNFFVSEEVRCWRKYQEIAEDLAEAKIERDIQDALVNCTEELLRSSGTRGGSA